ncbi:MAG: tRNA uridine-5-carboxymethylaminomethyl(34) synthesis GTPase MnmE [Bacteroidetes bacterium]|nr:tRNA uridine-5-carboxymethylaminomethyl(34) synthesis GTPase MnmE [Bacteroidota bacterium]
MAFYQSGDTIVALSSAQGSGAIALIRLSGPEAISIAESVFSKPLSQKPGNSVQFGSIKEDQRVIDEVLLSLFRAPHSYTGEDLVEISCHGSAYIIQELIALFCKSGARQAEAGEFTLRAFLNGKLDLSEAEAVADLIASDSRSSHELAMKQMRGGYSKALKDLRQSLIDYAALIELELDFSEEDVEFANRDMLQNLLKDILLKVGSMRDSFHAGNALKQGIPVVIAGRPNAGKSTLLNALLNEERAIVSDIAGTTRDTIEERFVLNGTSFRLIDTAGLRDSSDAVERIGIERTHHELKKAGIVLYVFDGSNTDPATLQQDLDSLETGAAHVIPVCNKTDRMEQHPNLKFGAIAGVIGVAAASGHIQHLLETLSSIPDTIKANQGNLLVSNMRHYQALANTAAALESALSGLDSGLGGELLAFHLREAIRHLGSITGTIDADELLGSIFGRFCIGK